MLLSSTSSHNSIKLLKSLSKQNTARLDYLSNPFSITTSPALRVAGLLDSIPAVKQPLVLALTLAANFELLIC